MEHRVSGHTICCRGPARCVLLRTLVLFLLLLGCLDSCARSRAQNLGLGGSWLRWLVGVRGVGSAATSRFLGLGRVHLVHAASHRSPPVGYRTERGQECRRRQATLVATFPHSSLSFRRRSNYSAAYPGVIPIIKPSFQGLLGLLCPYSEQTPHYKRLQKIVQ